MMLRDSEAVKCRYGSCIPKSLMDREVLLDISENSYQGTVCVALVIDGKPDKVEVIEYSYGSCSGCDDWEARDLGSAQITREIRKCISVMSKELFAKRLDDTAWRFDDKQIAAAKELLK